MVEMYLRTFLSKELYSWCSQNAFGIVTHTITYSVSVIRQVSFEILRVRRSHKIRSFVFPGLHIRFSLHACLIIPGRPDMVSLWLETYGNNVRSGMQVSQSMSKFMIGTVLWSVYTPLNTERPCKISTPNAQIEVISNMKVKQRLVTYEQEVTLHHVVSIHVLSLV